MTDGRSSENPQGQSPINLEEVFAIHPEGNISRTQTSFEITSGNLAIVDPYYVTYTESSTHNANISEIISNVAYETSDEKLAVALKNGTLVGLKADTTLKVYKTPDGIVIINELIEEDDTQTVDDRKLLFEVPVDVACVLIGDRMNLGIDLASKFSPESKPYIGVDNGKYSCELTEYPSPYEEGDKIVGKITLKKV